MNADTSESVASETGLPEETSPRLRRVRKLSRIFRLVSRIMIAVTVVMALVPVFQRLFEGFPALLILETMFTPMFLVLYAFGLGIVLILERMFNAFAIHGVLHPSGARYLKWLGGIILGSGCLQLGISVVMTISKEFPLMPGSFIHLFSSILLGASILMLGWVLEEASEMKDQQEHTI